MKTTKKKKKKKKKKKQTKKKNNNHTILKIEINYVKLDKICMLLYKLSKHKTVA